VSNKKIAIGVTAPLSLMFFERRISRLLELGWEVHIVVGQEIPTKMHPDPRVTVHIVPMRRSWSPLGTAWAFLSWLYVLRQVRPTHAWNATPKASLLGTLAAWVCGIPIRTFEVWGLRWDGKSGLGSRILRRLDQITALAATQTIAVSPSVANKMLRNKLVRQAPTVLGHGGTKGVDIVRFSPVAGNVESRPGHPPKIGFLGRLAKDKGIGDFINVASLVRKRIPDAVFIVSGEWDDADPPEVEVRQILEAGSSFELKGFVVDTPSYLQGLDVLCFPSHREGLPNAVLEAGACGVPTVGWDATGTCDAVIDGVTGYLIPKGDHSAMAEAVVSLVNRPETYAHVSAAARAYVVKYYSEDDALEAFVSALSNST